MFAICKGLTCERDLDNVHNKYAITLKNESQVLVGHVPIELSKICSMCLHDYGEIKVECIGAQYNRGERKGLKIPVDYRLTENLKFLEKLF